MKELSRAITMAAGLLLASGAAASDFAATSYSASGAEISLKVEGTYYSGVFDGAAAEIAAYDRRTKRLFVTNADANTVDVLSIRNIKNPRLLDTIDLSPYGAGVNSVAFKRGVVAIAVEADPKQDPGSIVFFNRRGKFLSQVAAGALPDMVTFTPDGSKVLVANEGEPNDDYDNDPIGSVSIIDLSGGIAHLSDADATHIDFSAYNGADLGEIRIFGPNASVAQDIEPEYIAISDDGDTAYVSLQENNAIAIIDIATASITDLVPLGTKAFSGANSIDASNRDGAINIAAWPAVGMYQPDAIATFSVHGETFVLTANEGDARDYGAFSEEARVKDNGDDYVADPTAYPNIDELAEDGNLGRLKITTATGDTDGDGDIDVIHAYGGRSFSILNAQGKMIYDSGNEFERITAAVIPENFNSTNDENGSFDGRSDDKGPEPEGVTVGRIDGKTYAFIGLERVGGIMVYDVSNPHVPEFVQYINNREFNGDAAMGTAGDLGPEGLVFIPRRAAPYRQAPLLVATNEVSGTTTGYSIRKMKHEYHDRD